MAAREPIEQAEVVHDVSDEVWSGESTEDITPGALDNPVQSEDTQ